MPAYCLGQWLSVYLALRIKGLPDGRCAPSSRHRLITPMVNRSGSPVAPPAVQQSALTPTATRKRRGRGRPSAENAEDVRKKLLDAARELFPRYGYRGVSSRQIGAAAGVNFAMIRYYFGGKPGLYREMLQGVLQPARKTLDAMSTPQSPANLAQVLENMTRSWAANPWVVGFVVREVLAPDGPMRAMFLREFPERLAPVVERMVEGEIAAGKLRADLDPRMLVLSIVSLAIFPFLTLPLTARVFGVRNDEEFVKQFLRHTTDLLAHGVGSAAFAI
jgi:TetR/AcrR family transcriptional regulator